MKRKKFGGNPVYPAQWVTNAGKFKKGDLVFVKEFQKDVSINLKIGKVDSVEGDYCRVSFPGMRGMFLVHEDHLVLLPDAQP